MENSAIETAGAIEARARFTVDGETIRAAAKLLAGKVVQRRNTVPILSFLHVAADPVGTVTLTANNLDQQASMTIAADVECPGAFCVEAANLADMARTLGKGAGKGWQLGFEDGEERATVHAGRTRLQITRLPVDDFPWLATPTADAEGDESAPLSHSFTVPAAQLVADLATLAPCISKEQTRYYLCGVALQRGECDGEPRLIHVATDGHGMAIAARPIPDGAEELPDIIIPGDAVSAFLAAAKLDKGATEAARVSVDTSKGAGVISIDLGAFALCSKLIDGTFPDWRRVADLSAAPTDETDAPLFPDLLPGAPTAQMERQSKACPLSIEWQAGGTMFKGRCPDDAGLLFLAMRMRGLTCDKKGFNFAMSGRGEARAYLEALAQSAGLLAPGDMRARVETMIEDLGETFAPYGRATQETVSPRLTDEGTLQEFGGRIVGMTIAGTVTRHAWSECVEDWETLSKRWVTHAETVEPIEGSYSILMPADGPQLQPQSYIEAADGYQYPVADNERAIHLSAAQVRALIGESCFETLEFPGADGKPRHVARWLWDDGASRFLIVGEDGRAPKSLDAAREYVTREEIEAALAGEPVAIEAAPIVDIGEPVSDATAPAQCEEPLEAPAIAAEPEIIASGPEIEPETLSGAPAVPVAEIMARLEALEARLAAPLSAEREGPASLSPTGAIEPARKRSAAHARAIRRAWAERQARRASEHKRARALNLALAQRRARQQAARQAADLGQQLDAMCRGLDEANRKRGRNARLARKRTRELVAAVNLMHTHVDALTAELDAARRSPTYFVAETGAEQIDLVGRSAYHAKLAVERAETAEHALAAMRARCERAEAARDQLADAVEAMGTRLANAEAAVRRLQAA